MSDWPAPLSPLVGELVALYVDRQAGHGTTSRALAAAPGLWALVDELEAFAGTPGGVAVARFWEATNRPDAELIDGALAAAGATIEEPLLELARRVRALCRHAVELAADGALG